jgi:hypothetical protein
MTPERTDGPLPERSGTDSLDSLAITVDCNEELTFKPGKPSTLCSALARALKARAGENVVEECISIDVAECGPFLPRRPKASGARTGDHRAGS